MPVPCFPAMVADVLTDRALNRATLARQMLLERTAAVDPMTAVDRLVGLQAQNPLDPYLALWSRLADFDPDVLGRAVEDRRLARIVVMRGTIHLVTAADALALPAVIQLVLDAEIARHPEYAPHLRGVASRPSWPTPARCWPSSRPPRPGCGPPSPSGSPTSTRPPRPTPPAAPCRWCRSRRGGCGGRRGR